MLYLLTFLHGTRRSARLNIFKNNKLSLLQACRTFYCWNDVYSTGGLFEIEDDLSWHNCSQVRLAQFFPSDTGRIVPNRGWHDCSQVKLARLFPGGCGILAFKFIFCFVVCSLARFFTSEFDLGRIAPCTKIMVYDSANHIHFKCRNNFKCEL